MPQRKTKTSRFNRRLIAIVLLTAIVLLAYYNKKYIRRAYRHLTYRYYKVNSKPSDFPDGYEVHGIDISHFQEIIDWRKLQAVNTHGDTIQFKFVYIKATQGIVKEDEMFDENWEDAKDQHIVRGAYHYFVADRNPELQANNFIATVKLKPGDLPPAVDVEDLRGLSKMEIVAALTTYLQKIEAAYGVKPVIYSNLHFLEDYLADDFKEYPFWISHFDEEEPELEDSTIHWIFWQHSKKADLLGINPNSDADVFNGTQIQFDSLLIK